MVKVKDSLAQREKKEQRANKILIWAICLLILLFAINVYLFTNVLFQVDVKGSSMESTLSDGQVLIVNSRADVDRGDVIIIRRHVLDEEQKIYPKIAPNGDGKFDLTTLNYPCIEVKEVKNYKGHLNFKVEGNVLTIDNPRYDIYVVYETEYSIVKRAIGIEGDTVKLQDGKVYLKKAGETEFTVLKEKYVDEGNNTSPLTSQKEWVCQKGEIFYLGDNRIDSQDSRKHGCCKIEEVEGVVSKFAIWISPVTTWINKAATWLDKVFS